MNINLFNLKFSRCISQLRLFTRLHIKFVSLTDTVLYNITVNEIYEKLLRFLFKMWKNFDRQQM